MFKGIEIQRRIGITGCILMLVLSVCLVTPVHGASRPETVTIGSFKLVGGEYQRQEGDIVIEAGVPCFVWARSTMSCDQIDEEHLHYNAADQTSLVDSTFRWIEYGPEHSEEEIHERCEDRRDGSQEKVVDSTSYFPEQHGDREPYYLQLVEEGCPPLEHLCYPVKEYQGPNAVPAVTMQLLPSTAGDTVNNDANYLPGTGDLVVVGFWEHAEPDYDPTEGGTNLNPNPCAGEPTMKIAYPVDYGSDKCYAWNHWLIKEDEAGNSRIDLHPNSALAFACDSEGELSLSQWTTMTCRLDEPTANCRQKTAARAYCCQDSPPQIWSQILSGCGKEPPGAR